MAFDMPRNVVLPLDRIDVRLDPGPHPFEIANLVAIEENWLREKQANPALFDGEMVLLSHLDYAPGRLEGQCHMIRYATFLYWRKQPTGQGAGHAFAHAALVAADNALVAIRMGAHTASPGLVYFAAGSFEPLDFPNGVVDVDFNMAREVQEETGLDITGLRREAGYHAISQKSGTVIFRRYFLSEDADTVAESIRDFVSRETDPEIVGPVIIRNAHDLPEGLAPHMRMLVEWHFSGAA